MSDTLSRDASTSYSKGTRSTLSRYVMSSLGHHSFFSHVQFSGKPFTEFRSYSVNEVDASVRVHYAHNSPVGDPV
jgi:hypothetical protein